jgi:hypothetical protein
MMMVMMTMTMMAMMMTIMMKCIKTELQAVNIKAAEFIMIRIEKMEDNRVKKHAAIPT